MDSNAIIVGATIAADVAAFCGVYVAYRAFETQDEAFRSSSEALRLSVSAELVSKLESRFDSEMARSRRSAASALLHHENLTDAEDVFDFFEAVGLQNRLGALNDEMVHSTFFHWINLYWTAGREYITNVRNQRSSCMWTDFAAVYKMARAIEQRVDPKSRDLDLSAEVLSLYLNQEMQL